MPRYVASRHPTGAQKPPPCLRHRVGLAHCAAATRCRTRARDASHATGLARKRPVRTRREAGDASSAGACTANSSGGRGMARAVACLQRSGRVDTHARARIPYTNSPHSTPPTHPNPSPLSKVSHLSSKRIHPDTLEKKMSAVYLPLPTFQGLLSLL